jgi:hypothetical protein
MSFLGKHNPHATRGSVTRWAIGGGVFGAVVAVSFCCDGEPPLLVMLPWMGVSCAFAFAVMEWQLPSSEYSPSEDSSGRNAESADGDQEAGL